MPVARSEALAATSVAYAGHGGLRLAGDAWGNPEQPSILLLHGGGQTRHAWARTAQTLAEIGWYAVALDLRGHGVSQWAADEDYSIDAFAADAVAVAATFHRPPVVVGASLGGIAALIAQGEASHPVFAALVLVDIAPRMQVEGVLRVVSFMAQHLEEGFATVEEAAAAIAGYLPHRPRPEGTTRLEKNLRRGPDGRYYWHWDPKFLFGRRPPSASGDAERLQRAARALKLPTLLLRGQLSDMISEEGVMEFLAAVPHARYVDVSHAGHMVVGDRNDVFADAVIRFLQELPPPSLR